MLFFTRYPDARYAGRRWTTLPPLPGTCLHTTAWRLQLKRRQASHSRSLRWLLPVQDGNIRLKFWKVDIRQIVCLGFFRISWRYTSPSRISRVTHTDSSFRFVSMIRNTNQALHSNVFANFQPYDSLPWILTLPPLFSCSI